MTRTRSSDLRDLQRDLQDFEDCLSRTCEDPLNLCVDVHVPVDVPVHVTVNLFVDVLVHVLVEALLETCADGPSVIGTCSC